ncbi:MAG: hypothetical protein NVSMB22_01660 [Chloroflexota bacterium]
MMTDSRRGEAGDGVQVLHAERLESGPVGVHKEEIVSSTGRFLGF